MRFLWQVGKETFNGIVLTLKWFQDLGLLFDDFKRSIMRFSAILGNVSNNP
jgi:hypothetical protein